MQAWWDLSVFRRTVAVKAKASHLLFTPCPGRVYQIHFAQTAQVLCLGVCFPLDDSKHADFSHGKTWPFVQLLSSRVAILYLQALTAMQLKLFMALFYYTSPLVYLHNYLNYFNYAGLSFPTGHFVFTILADGHHLPGAAADVITLAAGYRPTLLDMYLIWPSAEHDLKTRINLWLFA